MIDKSLRDLERLQDQNPLKLKLLQRRLGQGVYIQETPRPIQVFNDTELLIDISKENREGDGSGDGFGHGSGCGLGFGYGYGLGSGHGIGYGIGDEGGSEYRLGCGFGEGAGDKLGGPEYYYTEKLREKYDR